MNKRQPPQRGQKRGFTLIELLVVIAIIAVLAAILFPVFNEAKAAAKQTTCASNLKQIGLAMSLYSNDVDDVYPPDFDQDYRQITTHVGMHSWPGMLQPYSRNYNIWDCPSEPDQYDAKEVNFGNYFTNAYLHEWCNDTYMNYCGGGPCPSTPLPRQSIPYETTTPILQDGTGYYETSTYLTTPTTWCQIWNQGSRCEQYDRIHHGGANVLFCDGHVKRHSPDQFKSDNPDTSWLPVERSSCWYSYRHNDGIHPWYKP